MDSNPVIDSIKKKTPHSLRVWTVLLIVLLFGVTVGGSLPSMYFDSQEGSTIKSQTKEIEGVKVLYRNEVAYLCANPDGSDSYITSFGRLPGEFWTSGYYCKTMTTRKMSNGMNVLTTPTPSEMFRMYRQSLLLAGPGKNQRPYKYQCDDLSVITVEFTPPPTPPNTIYYGGMECDALSL